MTIPRPFTVRYNPYTQAIEVIDGKKRIVNVVRTLRERLSFSIFQLIHSFVSFRLDEMDTLLDALQRVEMNA